MALSKHMRSFLQTWWDERDQPSQIVKGNTGLCTSLVEYCIIKGLAEHKLTELYIELRDLLIADDLDEVFPFEEGPSEYYISSGAEELHRNPKRRAWVLSKLQGP